MQPSLRNVRNLRPWSLFRPVELCVVVRGLQLLASSGTALLACVRMRVRMCVCVRGHLCVYVRVGLGSG